MRSLICCSPGGGRRYTTCTIFSKYEWPSAASPLADLATLRSRTEWSQAMTKIKPGASRYSLTASQTCTTASSEQRSRSSMKTTRSRNEIRDLIHQMLSDWITLSFPLDPVREHLVDQITDFVT